LSEPEPAEVRFTSAGATPFSTPYRDVESAWRDAGFFSMRYRRAIRVVARRGLYWLVYDGEGK
jgi:hypothetical protein